MVAAPGKLQPSSLARTLGPSAADRRRRRARGAQALADEAHRGPCPDWNFVSPQGDLADATAWRRIRWRHLEQYASGLAGEPDHSCHAVEPDRFRGELAGQHSCRAEDGAVAADAAV